MRNKRGDGVNYTKTPATIHLKRSIPLGVLCENDALLRVHRAMLGTEGMLIPRPVESLR
jgi:hypothetical protein